MDGEDRRRTSRDVPVVNNNELSTLRARIKRNIKATERCAKALDSIHLAEGVFVKALDEGLHSTGELFENMESLALALNRGESIMKNIIEFCEKEGYITDAQCT